MNKKLILGIDFNNIVFASYYGEKLINSRGINVNAVKGFFFKVKMLKEAFNPDYIICANDLSRSRTFRRKMYAGYKAQRKAADPDIINQMQITSRLASLIGYPFINNELYEADDILGMVSRYAGDNNMDMVIASSDRDLYQLVNESTFIFSPKMKEVVDLDYMMSRYSLTPDQWIELKILQGDRSDNIPGIQGIGEVTALNLMQEFGSIANIYSNLDKLKPKVRDALINGKNDIPLTRELVTIVTDYNKIGLTEESIQPTERFENEIYSILEEMELYSLFNVMNYSLFPGKQEEAA